MLGRTAGFEVKPLPFTPNEPDLAASRFFFIMTMIIFLLILREATQSSLSAALLESSVHLDFIKQIVSAWLDFGFLSPFLGTPEAFNEST